MEATALLTLVALVVGTDGETAGIDKGLVDGLREGDRGAVYYTLTVGGAEKVVAVGDGRVVAVDTVSARLSGPPGATLRRGYRVRFELPPERLAPAALAALARTALDRGDAEGAALYVARIRQLAADDPRVAELEAVLAEARECVDMVRIPGGTYEIGVDLGEAKFYNQHPRFELPLRPLCIDRAPVPRKAYRRLRPDFVFPADGPEGLVTGVTFAEAESYCRAGGRRLPTELEWEVAAGLASIEVAPSILEWTGSWYKPYPGNRIPEAEYEGRYRVLRSATPQNGFDYRQRRFLAPGARQANVGFRCARDAGAD